MIVVTAGHVDHGKTALLHALTGMDADRLPEEKKRGMTIVPGYAWLPLPSGDTLGFVDVPGHEKFLSNMLSGIGGIHHALLVVACDDGVMPQTREHLTLLSLAGDPTLTIVLTKADRADPARIADVQRQSVILAQEMGWSETPLFVTSAVSGQNIAALREHLQTLTEPPFDASRRFRLAIDRAFTLRGTGLVVTGTALAGQVKVGETLWLSSRRSVRVRGLHAQNQQVEQAYAGQRIALNIAGNVEKEQITRGDWLLPALPSEPVTRLVASMRWLAPPRHASQPVHLHHAARHITGRITVLTDDLVELVPDTPLWLAQNDRLIVRDICAQTTLGGARVVLINSRRRGKRQPAWLDWLKTLAQAGSDAQALSSLLLQQPMRKDELAWARQLTIPGFQALMPALNPVIAGDFLLSQKDASDWRTSLLNVLEKFHLAHADMPGVGRDRLRRMALPDSPEQLVFALIDQLTSEGSLQNSRGWLHLPGFTPHFTPQEALFWQRISPLFGDEPLWVRDLAATLAEDEQAVRELLLVAARLGYVTAIVKDRYYLSERIDLFANLIRYRDGQGDSTTAADFRTQMGIGRKLAVQILEFLIAAVLPGDAVMNTCYVMRDCFCLADSEKQ